MYYTVDGVMIKTKKLTKEHIKDKLIAKKKYNDSVDVYNCDTFFAFLISIMKIHYYWKNHLNDILYFRIYNNRKKQVCLQIIDIGHNAIDVSYDVYNHTEPKSDSVYLTRAMRLSVTDQILDYIKTNPEKICKECNTTEDIQVDHVYEFKNIVKDFKEIEKDSPSFFKNNGDFLDANKDYSKKWQTFHKQKATYQYLCGRCNRDKNLKN